jgi:hypothetical protein
MDNLPSKCIAWNEPKKWNYLYTIVGLNRISDTSHRDVRHELQNDASKLVGPAASIASIHYRHLSWKSGFENQKYRGYTGFKVKSLHTRNDSEQSSAGGVVTSHGSLRTRE